MSSKFRFEFEDDTQSTIHLYVDENRQEEDRKPIIGPFLHNDDDIPIEISDSPEPTFYERDRERRYTESRSYPSTSREPKCRRSVLILKEVETQTEVKNTTDAATSVDATELSGYNDAAVNAKATADVGVMVDVEELQLNNTVLNETLDFESEFSATVESTVIGKVTHSDTYYQCEICSCYYLTAKKVQSHSLKQHNKMPTDVKGVPYDMICKFCPSVYVYASYNQHIKTKHKDMFDIKGNTNKKGLKTGPYECTICKIQFLTYNEGNRHRKAHDNVEHKVILRKISKPNDSPSTSKDVKNERLKIKIKNTLNRRPTPKSYLFQCTKCELNFFTYRNGLRHKILCEKGDSKCIVVNCSKCDKKFQSVHIKDHYRQHELSAHFKILHVVSGMEHKIVYRCMKCYVCMEEPGCRLHFQNECKTKSVSCNICFNKIDKDFIAKHNDAHSKMGLTKDEIILVDVFN